MRAHVLFLGLVFALFSTHLAAEADHDSKATGAETGKTGTRLESEGKLSKEVTSFLSTHFSLPEQYITNNFEKTIPPAIEKALKGEEEPISILIASLMGVVNGKQLASIEKDAEEKSKAEREIKEPEKRDDRFIALMDRLAWAAKTFSDTPSKDEKAPKFNEAFKKAYEKVKEWNSEANEKLKQASEGNEKAKEWIRENVSKSAILSWVEGQKKSGNSKAAERVIGALSSSQGKERFLDMWSGDNAQRLFLGKDDASLKSAVDGFFDKKGGFGGALASSKPHPKSPEQSWFMNGKEFTKGSPAGFEPVVEPVINPPEGPTPEELDKISKIPVPPEALVWSTTKCTQCHADLTTKGDNMLNFRFVKKGKEYKFADIIPLFSDPKTSMSDRIKITDADRAKFAEWATIQK